MLSIVYSLSRHHVSLAMVPAMLHIMGRQRSRCNSVRYLGNCSTDPLSTRSYHSVINKGVALFIPPYRVRSDVSYLNLSTCARSYATASGNAAGNKVKSVDFKSRSGSDGVNKGKVKKYISAKKLRMQVRYQDAKDNVNEKIQVHTCLLF